VPSSNGIYRFGEFELSVRARMLSRRGVGIPLPSKTFDVLHYLVANSGRVVTKDELLKGVWPDSFVEEGNLTQHVFRLRKALQPDPNSAPCIVTIPGQGYQFSAVVESGVETSAIEVPEEIVVQTVRKRSTFIAEEIVQPPLAQLAPRRAPQWRTIAVTFLAAIAFVALGIWGWNSWRRAGRIPLVPIMVPPFENRTGDSSFDLTLSNVLSIDMAQSPYFDVLSKAEFSRTLALMKRPPNEKMTEALAREICQRSNSRVLVSGAIDKLGTLYPLTIAATECSTGKTLANERAEPHTKEDVLKSLDRLTADLRRRLGESAASVQRFSVPLLAVESSSFDAVRDYSEAVDLYARGRTDEAMAPMKHAIELDPNFALAYSQLAIMYDNMKEQEPAIENISKAYALRDTVGDRSRFPLMANYYAIATGDLNEAMRSAQVWTETFPQDFTPWGRLANIQADLGEFPQALVSAKQQIALAPANAQALTTLAAALYHVGQFREAEQVCGQAITRGVDSPGLHGTLLRLAFLEHDQEGMRRQLEWSRTGLPERILLLQLAALGLRQGKLREALQATDRSVEEGNKRGLGGFQSLYALDAFLLTQVGLDREALTLLAQKDVASDPANGLVASTLMGDEAMAESTLADLVRKRPSDTLLIYVYTPQVRAVAALRHGHPKDAIQALGPALAYEMRDFHTPSLLGASYLAAGMPAEAELEYRRILDNPGIDLFSMQYPLAHLGLARALSQESKRDESLREYQRFFDDWKSADADLPVMKKARDEYQALTSAH
jgi:DNA-binding winged helix-turn-helix (wHTH) protein/tetratricopeptide (TPR) repeat protein